MSASGKKPKPGALIADADEVLECLTSVMRGSDAEELKVAPRDRLRAAELLARRFETLSAAESQAETPRIIDDIPETSDKEE